MGVMRQVISLNIIHKMCIKAEVIIPGEVIGTVHYIIFHYILYLYYISLYYISLYIIFILYFIILYFIV